jgi:hypothetical protein
LTLVTSTPNWWDTQQQAEGNHVSNIDLLDHDVGDSGSFASSGPDIAADVVIQKRAIIAAAAQAAAMGQRIAAWMQTNWTFMCDRVLHDRLRGQYRPRV